MFRKFNSDQFWLLLIFWWLNFGGCDVYTSSQSISPQKKTSPESPSLMYEIVWKTINFAIFNLFGVCFFPKWAGCLFPPLYFFKDFMHTCLVNKVNCWYFSIFISIGKYGKFRYWSNIEIFKVQDKLITWSIFKFSNSTRIHKCL